MIVFCGFLYRVCYILRGLFFGSLLRGFINVVNLIFVSNKLILFNEEFEINFWMFQMINIGMYLLILMCLLYIAISCMTGLISGFMFQIYN